MEWVLKQQAVDANFSNKICRIWGSENPQVIEEKPLHPKKVTVWCGLWSEGEIRPYFLEINDRTAVTGNSEHYGHMITAFFFPALEEYDLENKWFQEDGAACHTYREKCGLIARDISWLRNFSAISTTHQKQAIRHD